MRTHRIHCDKKGFLQKGITKIQNDFELQRSEKRFFGRPRRER